MRTPEPSLSVNVDLTNPGQFLACCGLLELAHRLWPGAEAWFGPRVFRIDTPGDQLDGLKTVLERLSTSEMKPDETRGDEALRPVKIEAFGIILDWWIDQTGAKTPLKLWAGQQTSVTIVEKLRDAIRQLGQQAAQDVFDAKEALTGRFGLDPRSAWTALDAGFSPNEQAMKVATFPAVELLAAVGLQGFRPIPGGNHEWRYATWGEALPPVVARAASAGILPAGNLRVYRFGIRDRGSYKGFGFATPL